MPLRKQLKGRKRMAFEPTSEEDLLVQREFYGNKCINCPYIPKHLEGSTKTQK